VSRSGLAGAVASGIARAHVAAMPVTIVGSYLSPYVRKVLACLHLKGIAYEVDPIVPFYGDDAFTRLSPLRRIPVLLDGDVTLCDSTIICEYLDERHPAPPLLPRDPAARARARWLEEWADTRLGEVVIWQLFDQRVIGPAVWRRPTDEAVVERTLTQDLPEALDYLEAQVPADGFLFGPIHVADVALASFFRNAAFAGVTIDAARWPRAAAFVARTLDHPCLATLRPFEEASLTKPPGRQREALHAAGAPLSAQTFGTATPRAVAGTGRSSPGALPPS
jgi:glutathione S-transferase